MPPPAEETAPRGAALEIAASDAKQLVASSSTSNDETEQLRSELRRWVQHCLQMDTALAESEARAAELKHRADGGGRKDSPSANSPSNSSLDSRRKRSEAKRGDSGSSEDNNTPHATPKGERDTRTPDISYQPAPMSQEVHKALVEQSLLPAGRMHNPGQTSYGRSSEAPTMAAGPAMIKLLLVEDDPFQADAILALCQTCGYDAEVASSANEALALVRARPEINLVLSDVMMEGASGYDLLCRIRSIRSHVSVIMLSAYESIDLVQQCILSGADAYLLKPLRVHELTNIWQYVWRRRHELQLMQQVSSLHASWQPRGQLSGVNLQGATKVKGGRQRLTKDRMPELVEASSALDKVVLVSTTSIEKQVREELYELVLEEPHSANKTERSGGQGERLGELGTLTEGPEGSQEGSISPHSERASSLGGRVDSDHVSTPPTDGTSIGPVEGAIRKRQAGDDKRPGELAPATGPRGRPPSNLRRSEVISEDADENASGSELVDAGSNPPPTAAELGSGVSDRVVGDAPKAIALAAASAADVPAGGGKDDSNKDEVHHLPASPYITPHLPTSPYISPHLPNPRRMLDSLSVPSVPSAVSQSSDSRSFPSMPSVPNSPAPHPSYSPQVSSRRTPGAAAPTATTHAVLTAARALPIAEKPPADISDAEPRGAFRPARSGPGSVGSSSSSKASGRRRGSSAGGKTQFTICRLCEQQLPKSDLSCAPPLATTLPLMLLMLSSFLHALPYHPVTSHAPPFCTPFLTTP